MRFKNIKAFLFIVTLYVGVGVALAKRAVPAEVPPMLYQGVKYVVPHWGHLSGKKQNGGYIEARDPSTDKLLWELMIYQVKYNPKLEGDVQDVFITSLKLINGNLEIVNEAKDKFLVDPSKREVIKGKGRVYQRKS
jgi:hypothetical protein